MTMITQTFYNTRNRGEIPLYRCRTEERVSVYLKTTEEFMTKVHVNWQKYFEKEKNQKNKKSKKFCKDFLLPIVL